jgi:carboxypeptidase PM20D1
MSEYFRNIIFWILGICFFASLANALRLGVKRKRRTGEAIKADPGKALKCAKDLSEMLKVKTVNDPSLDAKETHECFVGFQETLAKLFPLVFTALERVDLGTDALLLRWKGADPLKGAMVLMSHSDVVPASGEWKHAPFSGDIAEGKIWGRGAADAKGSLCAIFEAVEELLSEGFTPASDVYISSSNNEEIMGDGALIAMNHFRENGIPLGIVCDEGGVVLKDPLKGLSGYFAMIGVVEKGIANVKFKASSKGGHASAPLRISPFGKLASFINDIESHPPFTLKISKPFKQMIDAMAPYMPLNHRMLLGNLWLFGPFAKYSFQTNPQLAAMLHTTAAFTMSQGSAAVNVLPESASVTANVRFIMHQGEEDSLKVLKSVARRHNVETEVLYSHGCSPCVDIERGMCKHFVKTLEKTFPHAVPVPYIMIRGTDARHFSEICPCVIRCAPLLMDKEQLESIHSANENVDMDAVALATVFYRNLITGDSK